ncbi:MAG: succinate dehydrogenase iron-sulfur subunit [Phycisphaerae bacterium]|nr:succinate dehydrogenase iron-sulfur subunit [Phycisphaerae bacterium]NNF43555.1 succinate dehydrogenase iron-sulfur subunit [Phycisphaerales bacterium]
MSDPDTVPADPTPSRTPATPAPPAHARRIRLKIRRQDDPQGSARWEEFEVPVEPGANIISCLQWIATHPTTRDGETTTPVVFDACCLEEVCGACSMLINGTVRQSCSCLIDEYAPHDGDTIVLEPMSKFPLVRDLMVDRERLFHNLSRVQAWVPIDGTYHLGPGPADTPKHQRIRYKLSECMSCGCCLEACPQFNLEPAKGDWDHAFIGAHAISQAHLFNEHPTGGVLKDDRLDVLTQRGGVSDCGNAQNCVKACPKEIPLTESIAAVGRSTTVHSLKRFFSGRASD